MIKHVTVAVIIDDHEPEKCGEKCKFRGAYLCGLDGDCLYDENNIGPKRTEQCLKEAK